MGHVVECAPVVAIYVGYALVLGAAVGAALARRPRTASPPPPPRPPLPPPSGDRAAGLVEQARRNAEWWRDELRDKGAGFAADPKSFEWLLQDLETAGGKRR